jgi:hypothetical protein
MKKAEGNKILATHLAAVLSDPNTPEGIYNALREKLLDAATEARVSIDDPAALPKTLARVLDMMNAQGAQTSSDDGQPQGKLHDALQRTLDRRYHDFKPITHERAAELADTITAPFVDDTITFSLLELLEGIGEAAIRARNGCSGTDGGDFEGLILFATRRAYTNTAHFSAAFDEFASLDPDNPRDRRVLTRAFVEDSHDK